MLLREICEKLQLKVLAGADQLDQEISGVYICDLLSWVMSHAKKGNAWITVQTHTNVVAVGTLLELGCIIVPENISVETETLARAEEEGIPVLQSAESAYAMAMQFAALDIGR